MASKYSNDDESIAEINVVPLVDIVLVVLIIFMVTAPMLMKPSIRVNLPKAATGEATEKTKLNVTIQKSGEFLLNGQSADENAIKQRAQDELSKNPDTEAIIAADQEVPHGTVVHMLDVIKSVGIRKFGISIDKK